jgi:hypothetical protein
MTTAEDRDAERAIRRLIRAFGSTDSYGLVVVMIVATYVLSVSLTATWGITIVLFAQIATVWLTLRTSASHRPLRRAADVLFVVAGVAAVANLFAQTEETFLRYVFAASCVLYLVAPFTIIRHIAFRRQVDRETVLGALATYLLIGMAFAFCYRFFGAVQDADFFGAQGDGTVAQDLFFSFVTLTTTGYGNLVPAGNPGQSLAVLEALLGQLFLVTAVAKVVNAWTPKRWREPETPG